jgi:hypothetical protein
MFQRDPTFFERDHHSLGPNLRLLSGIEIAVRFDNDRARLEAAVIQINFVLQWPRALPCERGDLKGEPAQTQAPVAQRAASNPLSGTLARIEAALVAEGIIFLPDGVRLRRR